MKRLAMLETDAGRPDAARRAVEAMARHYQRALDISRERHAADVFYPASNLIAATVALHAGTRKLKRLPATLFDEARRSVQAKNQSDPDFWSLVAVPELRLYEAVANGKLPASLATITRELKDVFKRSQGGTQWSSVADTMQFVLGPYIKRASPQSRKAALAALEQVKQLAGTK